MTCHSNERQAAKSSSVLIINLIFMAVAVLAGLDAGAMLDFRPGALVVAIAFLSDALGVLAAERPAVKAGLGPSAVAGFLAATTFKQYILRGEEAELRLADTQRAAEEHARAVRLAERAGAAREIHDILAHSLGALVLQLDAVEALLATEPADVTRALPLVGRARLLAAEGLTESRRAVGSLRDDPLPIVDSLRQLVQTMDAAALEVSGTPWPLPSEVTLAVRRTAPESLTNAAKHAPGSTPVVRLRFDAEDLVLTVSNDGSPNGVAPAFDCPLGRRFWSRRVERKGPADRGHARHGADRRWLGGHAPGAASAVNKDERGGVTDALSPPVRVVVADDQRAIREALATVLDVVAGIEVVGVAADGEEAVTLALALHPYVVLMDLRMPGVDGDPAPGRAAAGRQGRGADHVRR